MKPPITRIMYRPKCLDSFPHDLADSLLDQALETHGFSKERLAELTDDEKRRLDAAVWRLVTAVDVSDQPCGDSEGDFKGEVR